MGWLTWSINVTVFRLTRFIACRTSGSCITPAAGANGVSDISLSLAPQFLVWQGPGQCREGVRQL